MDKAALVKTEIERAVEIVEALDAAGFAIKAAIWVELEEYGDWRLLLAAPEFDAVGPAGDYELLFRILERSGMDVSRTPPFLILPLADPTIRSLRKLFGRTRSVEGMRLGGQRFGDRFFEDGIALRIR